ncbi:MULTISPECIES: Ger(x)C family spore germination protein [unclassified Paenibacillus]|uniref:Ger(x)C family spore germination protein n=1 Tax=unclassified Paenibacillus TaxID=185978 RepID=UPI0010445B1B|nr:MULTISPECIES: Ger(x)C family spore germination protein [unclassified Paenibacillus]NIK71798.1 Ger(x)C family germination protein [Paenibacillus sp. BK720]TCM96450.1 Ger(x)C family germination protein [Paenibacillus sp. BK033]
MIRSLQKTCLSLVLLFASAGCTDFVEPNQLAFVIGTGIDHAGENMLELSHQIAVPSQLSSTKGGSNGKSESFIVISAKGKNVFEANEKLQRKMSRRLITSHRTLIAISDQYIENNNTKKLFDKLNRDPANNQRDIIVVVKGSAKEFMKIKHPLEQLSSIATNKELRINGMNNYSIRQFFIEMAQEGTRILVPLLQIDNHDQPGTEKAHFIQFAGFAVLDNELKLKGILNDPEGSRAIWMIGKGTFHGLTIPWKEGNGTLSFRLTHLEREIHSVDGNDPKHILLTVKAQAYLLDNTTTLDMSEVDNMIALKKYLDERVEKDMQATLNKVQGWGQDIFGIGEYLHRKHPYWWKTQKNNWDDNFKNINVSVKANILLRSTGTSAGQVK